MAAQTYFEGTGKRLGIIRRQLGISRKDMAGRLGLSWAAYYKNESGETFPRQTTLIRLEKEYDISMDWFMFGKGGMHYSKERARVQALEKESESLKKNSESLKKELEAAREKDLTKEKSLELKGFGVERKVEVKELLDHMSRITLLYHEVMVHFQRFKMENRDLVDISMAAPKS